MGVYVQRGILLVAFAILLVVSLEYHVANVVGLLVGCYGLLYGFVSHESKDGDDAEAGAAEPSD